MNYNVGDRVLIVSERPEIFNNEGEMDCYLGTIMTIDRIEYSRYKMEEDGGQWWYDDTCIERLVSSDEIEAEVPNVFNEDLPTETRERLIMEMISCLEHYKWHPTYDGCAAIIDEWWRKKRDLIHYFSRLPDWNAEKFMVVFSHDFDRNFDEDSYKKSVDFIQNSSVSLLEKYECPFSGVEIRRILNQLNRCIDLIDDPQVERIAGYTRADLPELYKMKEKYRLMYNGAISGYTPETYQKYNIIQAFFSELNDIVLYGGEFSQTLSSQEANSLNRIAEEIGINLKAVGGQKITRVARKFFVATGLDKKEGFEHYYAMLSDSLSPLKIKRHTILSFNPIDYLRSSMGNSWSSCHTIDRANVDKREGSHYSGMHANGTMSYLLDGVTGVFYTVNKDYDGTDFEWQDKLIRQLYHFGTPQNPFFIQGRLYPQGNDSGSNSVYKELREIVQKLTADAWGVNNLWKAPIDTIDNHGFYRSYGTNYRDYENFSNCTISRLSSFNGTYKFIRIGAKPICIECGSANRMPDDELSCCRDFYR